MSPLSGFLAVIVFFTATLVAYLTKQFQNENLNYSSSNQMKNTNTKVKTIEKEKVVAETLNGRFAMLGLIAAVGAYLTTGQIIPGFVKKLRWVYPERNYLLFQKSLDLTNCFFINFTLITEGFR